MRDDAKQGHATRPRTPLLAYRLVYDDSPRALPPLWEWQQPSIHRGVWNTRHFGREVVQRYFEIWDALDGEYMSS